MRINLRHTNLFKIIIKILKEVKMQDITNNSNLNIPEITQPKNFLGKWSTFFIERYKITYLILLIIIILGVHSYVNLPRELQPEIILPYAQILVPYSGATPEEIETLITNKIENNINDIENLKGISSFSAVGYSMILLEFEQGTDMDKGISDVREKINSLQNQLPDDSDDPTVYKVKSNSFPIMIVNLSGDFSQSELKYYAKKIKQRLESEKNIAEAIIIGGLEREIKINVNPEKLAIYGISPTRLKQTIQAANINWPGGIAEFDNKNFNIRTVGELKTAKQIAEIIIGFNGSNPLRVKDIADVKKAYKDIKSYSRMSVNLGEKNPYMKESVALSIKKKDNADILKTSATIMKILDEGRGDLYPKTTNIKISGNTAKYIEEQLGAVTENAISGLLLVLIVLFLFIGLREAGIVSIVIPLSILMSLFFLDKLNMTLNTITLFSLVLAVGMLVDNGIVIMENVDRLRNLGLDARTAAETGANQIAPAVMASTLTTLAAFFPIALTQGVMGAFIKPIPITVMIALISSLFLAITLTPALCSRLLRGKQIITDNKEKTSDKKWSSTLKKIFSIIFIVILSLQAFKGEDGYGFLSVIFATIFGAFMFIKIYITKKSDSEHPFINKYASFLNAIISKRLRRWAFTGILIIAFILSLSLIPLGLLNIEMFSGQDVERIYVDINTPDGSTIEQTTNIVSQIEKILFDIKEIDAFVSNIGITGASNFDSFNMSSSSGTPNIARIIIDLKDAKELNIPSTDVAKNIRKKVTNISGAEIQIYELQAGPPSDSPISIGIIGDNLEKMELIALQFQNILKSIEGTRDITTSIEKGSPELEINIDKTRAAKYGLNDFSIAQSIREHISGLKVTTLRQNKEEIDVTIYTGINKLKTKNDLNNLYFYTPDNRAIRFNQIASFRQTNTSPTIHHEDMRRRINIIGKTTNEANSNKIMSEFIKKTENISLPDGISVKYAGEMGEVNESFTDMFINMIVAAILVYIILVVQFNSLTQPLIILFAVPLGLIGVMPGLLITGNSFNFLSFIGVVALVGIAVNDAIVLVDYINYLRKNGYKLKEAVLQTGKTRFMPVLATTITTAGGILPISMKEPFFAPMGVALIFGLMMSTILTLIAIPNLYTMLETFKINRAKKRANIIA